MQGQNLELSVCPRCGDESFEYLESYSHCASCLYSPTFDEPYEQVPKDAIDLISREEAALSDVATSSSEAKRTITEVLRGVRELKPCPCCDMKSYEITATSEQCLECGFSPTMTSICVS